MASQVTKYTNWPMQGVVIQYPTMQSSAGSKSWSSKIPSWLLDHACKTFLIVWSWLLYALDPWQFCAHFVHIHTCNDVSMRIRTAPETIQFDSGLYHRRVLGWLPLDIPNMGHTSCVLGGNIALGLASDYVTTLDTGFGCHIATHNLVIMIIKLCDVQ